MLAGAVASFCLPPFGFVILIVALSWPALDLVRANQISQAMRIGWAAGFGWFLASTWWIAASMVTGDTGHWPLFPFAVLFVPFLLSLFWSLAAAISWRVGRQPATRLLWFIVMLGLAEWARGHVATGFPWNAPGYLFSAHLSLLQAASVLGLYALNLLAIGAAMVPAFWFLGWRRLAVLLALLLPLMGAAGSWRLANDATTTTAANTDVAASIAGSDNGGPALPKHVRLVQPAIPQNEKWDRDRRPAHLERLRSFSMETRPVPQLVIWPETAFAGLLAAERDLFRRTVAVALPFDGLLITGVPRRHSRTKLLNSAVLVAPDGTIRADYDKRKLVPFGEFFPFRSLMPFATTLVGPMDYIHGTSEPFFQLPHYGVIRPLICYEVIFPGLGAGLGAGFGGMFGNRQGPRPDILVNLTNGSWFGGTPGPYQHLAQARMRAVEEGIPMVRVANTGISAAFDGYGRELARIEMGVAGFADVVIPDPIAITAYARWREMILMIGLLLLAVLAIGLDQKRRFGQ